MFEFFKDVKDSVKEIDKLTSKNKFMSNPFSTVVNQTYVWEEKNLLFNQLHKK